MGYVNTFDIIADVNANNNPNRVAKDLHKYRFSGEGGQLFDVTDELEESTTCSLENPAGCTTREQCYSLGGHVDDDSGCYNYLWEDGTCIKEPCPQ